VREALHDSHPVARVVSAIVGRGKETVTLLRRRHLKLPKGLAWPAATNNVLYVRACYRPLFDGVLNKCTAPARLRSRMRDADTFLHQVITGQPGIGKSVFGWYMIYRLLTEQPGRTVVYCTPADTFVINPGGRVSSANSFDGYMQAIKHKFPRPDVVVIADSFLPLGVPFPTYVLSAPGRLTDQNTLNTFSSPLFMPLPSVEEMSDMRRVAFSDVHEADMERTMGLWGPVPRHVFEKRSLQDQLAILHRAMALSAAQLVSVRSPGSGPVRPRILLQQCAGQDPSSNVRVGMRDPLYYVQGADRVWIGTDRSPD
jgi:hypothetical protein